MKREKAVVLRYHRGCLLEKVREEPAAAKCLIAPAPDATSEELMRGGWYVGRWWWLIK